MPVTTETFRDQNKLHLWFALSGVLLVVVVLAAVFEDWHREFRRPQVEVVRWETEMTRWNAETAAFAAHAMEVDVLEAQLAEHRRALQADPEYQRILAEIAEKNQTSTAISRRLGLEVTGNIAPTEQRLERLRALVQTREGTRAHQRELERTEAELERLIDRRTREENEVRAIEEEVERLQRRQWEIEAEMTAVEERLGEIRGELDRAHARLMELEPGLLGMVGNLMRNAPLLDFANPSIKVRQQVVEDVLMDVNLMQVRTLDRCMSCHVTIDNPAFSEDNVLAFLEFQVARDLEQPVFDLATQETSDPHAPRRPVVMLDFWERAVEDMPSPGGQPQSRLAEAQREAVSAYAQLIAGAEARHPVRSRWQGAAESPPPVQNIADARMIFDVAVAAQPSDWRAWYAPLERYRETLQEIVDSTLSKDQRRAFYDSWRHALVDTYNDAAQQYGRKRLTNSRLILAHPNLDLYTHPDSKHPIAAVGCTSCHEGSGEETQFIHTVHTPADIWVDAKTGMLVPEFTVRATGSEADITRTIRGLGDPRRAAEPGRSASEASDATEHGLPARANVEIVRAAYGAQAESSDRVSHGLDAHAPDSSQPTRHHADHWYADAQEYTDPFGPPYEARGVKAAAYVDPATGEITRAVKQRDWWKKRYGWKEVEYHYWERPMHELQYIESSCNRCHTQEMEIDQYAPTLALGRKLFAEVGCVDCHAVDSLGSTLYGENTTPDVRQVGPDLTHVHEKMSEEMIASWTWAPKAFRPNSRMPHFFLTENNSSPLDVRRTRAEVAAMAAYLARGNLNERPEYYPEPLPTDSETGDPLAGDARSGRELFNAVGCLACHANVNETGLDWVLLDLQERFALNRDQAMRRVADDARAIDDMAGDVTPEGNVGFFELDGSERPTPRIRPDQYTRLHWYLMAHQPQRFTEFGPELSSVGTKLLHGRTREQAMQWLYDWLRNPSHYSEYTPMPSFRLTKQEALDLTAYLLEQTHPTYEPQGFAADEEMIDALLINLQRNAISERAARRQVEAMDLEEKQLDLGHRMIQHYGCFGCHQTPGFDSSLSVGANLSSWGVKNPELIDYGYFEHIFHHQRPSNVEAWTAWRAGLTEEAPNITEEDARTGGIARRPLEWEDVPNDRRGFLFHKIHNPRLYDRNRLTFEGEMTDDGRIVYTDRETRRLRLAPEGERFIDLATGRDSGLRRDQVEIRNVGDPYLKLRMPRFFLRDSEARALVTYVTSLRPPLVRANLQNTADDAGRMRAKGRLMAEAFNCYACHNIENNVPTIQLYYEMRLRDGSLDVLATIENLQNAPPRLVGNAARTHHDWYFSFLNNVEMIRPWLKVRMPSYNLSPKQTQWLVEYFAGQTQTEAKIIQAHLDAVDRELALEFEMVYGREYAAALEAGHNESRADELAKSAAAIAVGRTLSVGDAPLASRDGLTALARGYGLYSEAQLPDPSWMTEEEIAFAYGRTYHDMRFLRDTYAAVDYPFQVRPIDDMDDFDFHRGEMLVRELGCLDCHRVGDWAKIERIFEIEMREFEDDFDDDDPYADPYADDDPYADPYADDDPYGEDDPYGAEPAVRTPQTVYDLTTAPNLSLAHRRLQEDWVRRWVRKPATIMPNTPMPGSWGPDGRTSAFALFPSPMREEKEALYGRTADEQIDLIVRWIMAAGKRGHTLDEHKLTGEEAAAPIDVDALIRQRIAEAEQERREAERIDLTETPDVPAPQDPQEVELEPPPAPVPPRRAEPVVMTPEEQESDREERVAELVADVDAQTGAIVGLVLFEGRHRPQAIRTITAECRQASRQTGIPMVDESIVVNPNGTVANCIVYVTNAPAGHRPSRRPPEIDQIACRYIPHVVSITTGEELSIRNSDAFSHNLNLQSRLNPGFNVSQPIQGMVHTVRFNRPETGMRLRCDVHPWMNSFIHVFDHPFHATTDDRGAFAITGLPPGEYEVVISHDELGEHTFTTEVQAGAAARIDATFGQRSQ